MTLDLWLAMLCAILFAAGALMVKRANQLGAGPWITTLTSNLSTALAFMLLVPLGGQIPSIDLLWQPLLVAVLFIAGQALVFLAYHRGDVSVATPVLGIKIILVALFTVALFGGQLAWQVWVGAVLSTLAVVLLNRSGRAAQGNVGMTLVLAGGCAVAFALFDVLVQAWAPAWGTGRFTPVMMLFVGVISLALHPFFGRGAALPRGPARKWLLWGNALIAVQSAIFVTLIVVCQNAAPANVVFSSRGLWSVVLVWLAGHWLQSEERTRGTSVLRARLTGAVLMTLAIAIVMLG